MLYIKVQSLIAQNIRKMMIILNNQIYLLFVRDDIFEPETFDTWFKERLGVSYYDKDKYLIKGSNYLLLK